MAFYVPHPQQSAAKAKIDGFQPSGQQHQPPSPSNTFDPSSLFFAGPVFPDPFRNPHAGSGSMDFTETLLSMMPNNGGDQNQQHNQANGQQQQQQAQSLQQQQQQQQNQQQQSQAGQPGAPLNLNIPQNIFDMSHFASPLSAFQQPPSQQQPQQQRNTPKTESVDSPASLHTGGHGFFDNSGTQPQQSHNPFAAPSSIPSYLNTAGGHRPESPTVANSIGSPSESGTAAGGGPTSPFPTHASHARMHGHRSPSIGPTSHSRSRSRGATSRPPASRNGMGKTGGPKRQSISSTPEEPATALPPPPPPNARPQAILIPSHPSHPAQQQQQQQQQQHHHAHHLSHEFTPHQLSSIGPHPISPLGIHSTQTAPGAWFVPSSGQAGAGGAQSAVEPGSFGIQHQDGIQQSFGQAFQPSRSLSLGPNPKPGTSASASVLAGSLGTVPVGAVGQGKSQQEMAMDAAAKQAAILNEKRRRRRESHNAVERRRRDNINEKISELSTLLPESMLDPTGTNAAGAPTTAEGLLPTGSAAVGDGDDKETPAMKANKGIILRKSVEYIR
ncbi:hypothetical protein M407DRAFT_177494 [Tulasnella calospora MUT 4182]|uniref:BHLH domain-containing protein n=1 Tax=Tulasnella calospora MUT 4182 TaxID=1051891 RepID=A0A0C3QVQ6_9AGAM|nr:hypothetical protein M407DRAFT_177494 [Tulasnella calospora MUT 4182]